MMHLYIRLIFFFIVLTAFAKVNPSKKYPEDYFQSPVNTTIRLSGTFGELRPNHFHAGIDIKGHIGKALFAAADGYIARIKVQRGGYGKVLYINHPNGYTTVYAHMNKFTPELESYVKSIQYEQQQYEVDAQIQEGLFVYEKGQEIGTMGITGRSFGPHLHFEIRATKTDKPINPLLFGLKVEDNRSPRLHQLKVYNLNENTDALTTKTINLIQLRNGHYTIPGDTVFVETAHTGLAVKAYDHMNGVTNWNGVYTIDMLQEDSLVFSIKMNEIPFEESRYINAYLDYEEQVTEKSYFNRCYLLPGNQLSIYDEIVKDGIIELKKGQSIPIEMRVKDIAGNTTALKFQLKRKPKSKKLSLPAYNYKLDYDEEHIINTASIKLYFPQGTFYDNFYLDYDFSLEQSTNVYSAVHHVHDYKTPVHKYYDIAIFSGNLPDSLVDKAFIAYCDKENTIINCGGTWEGDMLKTKARVLGDFSVMVDQIPPSINSISFRYNMRGRNKMSFEIRDNFLTASNVKGLDYYATIDGQWVLMEFDEKKDRLTYYFENLKSGEHLLHLVVMDNRNNAAVFERKFVY